MGIVEAVTSFAKNVKEKDEALPAEVVKVIVAALCLYKRRFKDVFMREYVEVCVCMCGWWRGEGGKAGRTSNGDSCIVIMVPFPHTHVCVVVA